MKARTPNAATIAASVTDRPLHFNPSLTSSLRKAALLLLSLAFIGGSVPSYAQLPAGPEANPNKRMDCATKGDIRNDSGRCVPVELYLSNGTNSVYWVDQSAGLDSNPGTKSRPWKTLQRANKTGQLTAGDAVIVRGGTYRESIRPKVSGKSGALVTFSAYPGERVIISGAIPANSGWTVHRGNVYKRPFTKVLDADCPWTDCSSVSWRRELLIVDSKLMRQVGDLLSLDQPGEFFVDGNPPATAPKWMYARFPADQAPANFNIEVGDEESLFLPEGMTIRTCKGDKAFYRVIGFNFRHAVNARQAGAVCSGTQGSLFEDNTIEATNALGINLAGRNHTLRGNLVINNGQSGIEGGCDNCLLEYNESSANNWRRHARGYNGGGGKFSNTNGTVIRHHIARNNIGRGLWLDNSNYNNVIENSFFIHNEVAGLHLEYKSNYNLIRNNVFYGTKWDNWTGSGLLSHAANNNTIVHNSFIANEGIGLWIRFNNREPDGYNKIYNNLFVGNATTADVNSAYEIALVTETNQLDGNIYWSHEGHPGPTFLFSAKGWQGNDIATWRKLTGGERNAKVVSPSSKLIENLKSYEGWRLVANSIAIAESAALPSTVSAVRTDIENDSRSSTGSDVGADEYSGIIADSDVTSDPTGGIGETGTVSISQAGRDQWHKVTFRNSYAKPVVTMGPLSANGSHPSTLRVRNVTSTSFEFQLAEWDYLDGNHASETAGYLVVEAGVHTLGNGQIIQAGYATAGPKKSTVNFPAPFLSTPVVLSQVGSFNSPSTIVTRQSNVSGTSFSLLLQNQEASSLSANESVGWIAISKGKGSTGGIEHEAGTADGVTHTWNGVNLQQAFSVKPVIIAAMQTTNGVEPAALRHRNATSSGFEVTIEEEQSLDTEVNHAPENLGYVAFELGTISGVSSSATVGGAAIGESGTVNVRQGSAGEWHALDFSRSYVDPVVVITKVSYNGAQPATVRVRNVTSTGCEFQLDEWDYLDGAHTEESFGFLVLEAGTHKLENGGLVQAGHNIARMQKGSVPFHVAFTSVPVVVSQLTSANDGRAAVIRQTDISKTSFSVFLQPQESVSSYGEERVSWIAMADGTGSTGGRRYEARRTAIAITDSWNGLSFNQSFSSTPGLVAAMQTAGGKDVAGVRMRNHTASGFAASVEEEQSADKETQHTAESVGYIAFDAGVIEASSLLLSAVDSSPEAVSPSATAAADLSETPLEFALHGNYPNPFNPQTTIRYDLPENVHVQLEIFDAVGRRVALLADEVQGAGSHEIHFNGADRPSGLYLYRLKAGSFVETGRMILLK